MSRWHLDNYLYLGCNFFLFSKKKILFLNKKILSFNISLLFIASVDDTYIYKEKKKKGCIIFLISLEISMDKNDMLDDCFSFFNIWLTFNFFFFLIIIESANLTIMKMKRKKKD